MSNGFWDGVRFVLASTVHDKLATLEAENEMLKAENARLQKERDGWESDARTMKANWDAACSDIEAAEAKLAKVRLCCKYGPANMDALKAANAVVIRADELEAVLTAE